ncbi:hypothetical protein N657DRAFT_643202 [Parathielavia appendiculata]|uniref:Protein kinase domain-containing protein n=1 Tax=Parathielavia appendiculata TaxID=2587402 RepID=A0AAN6U4S1_9PEZI|nr:hypothetical protein N657DRAFT_643202 [Parathielavia appendiculata]
MTIFQAWDEAWTDSNERLDKKITEFAETDTLLARGILQQLVALLRTLSDPEKLKRRYGLVLQVSAHHQSEDLALEMKYGSSYLSDVNDKLPRADLAIFDENRLRHMAFLQKIRFGISGTVSSLEDLFGRLDEFNRYLQLLAPQAIRANADRKLFELAVKDIGKDPDKAKRLEEGAAYEAKHSIDQGAKARFEDLSKLVNFSLAIQSANPDMSRKKIFSRADFSFDKPYYIDRNTTLARLFDYPTKHQSRIVLVEWVFLDKHASGSAILKVLDETKVTWSILHAHKPLKILLPSSIGLIFDDSSPRNIGIVFQLPPHIRGRESHKDIPGEPTTRVIPSPTTVAEIGKPTSLRQLILKEPQSLDLGIRFLLAKQLLDAVHLMHTARFTHRNIRPDNLLFFPVPRSRDQRRHEGRDGLLPKLDFTKPLIVGFHDAYLQIQVSSDPPPPYSQPEGLKPILKNSNRKPPRDVVIDCYTHPERRLDPRGRSAPYRLLDDLYSVGCVLLELGLWETLDHMEGEDIALRAPLVGEVGESMEVVMFEKEEEVCKDAEVVKKAAKRLDVITGRIYAEVTRECLSPKSPRDVLETERRLAAKLAQVTA